MFCSNCGKTIRPEDSECRHCGAVLGEDRFFGSTYTASQVRVPVDALNQAPEGGMMSYTRTSYMSYDNQPVDDVYSNTTYRPLLTEEEDISLQAAEEQPGAAESEPQPDEFEGEAPAEEPAGSEADESELQPDEFEDEAPAEDVPGQSEEEKEYRPLSPEELDREFPLDPLEKPAISPRVRSYMNELDRRQQRRSEGSGLRMPSFLKRKSPLSSEEAYDEELPEAEDVIAADSADEFVADEVPIVYEDETFADSDESEESFSEEAYAEAPAEDYAKDYAEEYPADDVDAGEYIADADGDVFEHFEDADDPDDANSRPSFDFSALLEGAKSLLKNRILQLAAAGVLIVAVIIAGIVWLNFVTAKRAKIADVTYSAYTQGIELISAHVEEEYRDAMEQVYLTNTSYANETFAQDMSALNALMPAEPLANDELFVTTLTIIQDSIADAIKADADAALNGTEAEHAEASTLAWQAIGNAVSQLSEATNPGELSVIVVTLENIVAPSPSPSPTAPATSSYTTLTNGMMDSVEVKMMQNRLINLGYLEAGSADGDFGNGTESAVKAFQRAAGLTADGIATPEVQIALFADDAPRTGSALTGATETPAPENPVS